MGVDTFDVFANEVRGRFAYLNDEFGFQPPEDRRYASMLRIITYQSSSTRVEIKYEIGSLPWVVVSCMRGEVGRHVREAVNLDVLINNAREASEAEHGVPQDVPDDVLVRAIDGQAQALRRLAAPYLRGEFNLDWASLVRQQQGLAQQRAARLDG